MRQDRRVNHVLPDGNSAHGVAAAYRAAMAELGDDGKAFDAAVQTWRQLHPDASAQLARPAVADILSHALQPHIHRYKIRRSDSAEKSAERAVLLD
jgi:hypothetical protein